MSFNIYILTYMRCDKISIKRFKLILILIFVQASVTCLKGQTDYLQLDNKSFNGYPDALWYKYQNIENECWDLVQLKKAHMYYDSLATSAIFLVQNGGVVLDWGSVNKKYMTHSMRKSFLFSLIGIYVESGDIVLNKTIKELGINDIDSLTEQEKSATILQLLQCRSGIYHRAANEAPIMEKTRPKRGSHPPGSFYYYNNWDYNALLTIFEQETHKHFFEEFKIKIAEPIGMENFQLEDCDYEYDSLKSIHPAYPCVMTTKDLARYGLLYLKNGKWKDKQIIPEDWITKETTAYSRDWLDYGAGFKWIIPTNSSLSNLGTYYTSGYRGHRLFIIPKLNIVFVHRVDTYTDSDYVDQRQIERLLKMILLANKGLLSDDVYDKMKSEIN
jgi:CubicO group peptidase (beta-lactamase class C family)